MDTFRVGNVIRKKNSDNERDYYVVIYEGSKGIRVCPFNSDHTEVHILFENETYSRMCICVYNDNDGPPGTPDPECEDCHGTGEYEYDSGGIKDYEKVNNCIHDFIMDGFNKMFYTR